MVPKIVLIAGISMILSAFFGALIANMKNRSSDKWGFACFMFPPLLLLLIFMPKCSAQPRRKKISQNDLDEDIRDEWF